MGNEQASRVVQAPGTKTNQDELARPPIALGTKTANSLAKTEHLVVPLGMSLPKHHVQQVFKSCHRSRQRSSEPPKNVTVLEILLEESGAGVCR